jgi:hypothetical protein
MLDKHVGRTGLRKYIAEGGGAAVYDYLMHYDIGEFNPFSIPDGFQDALENYERGAERSALITDCLTEIGEILGLAEGDEDHIGFDHWPLMICKDELMMTESYWNDRYLKEKEWLEAAGRKNKLTDKLRTFKFIPIKKPAGWSHWQAMFEGSKVKTSNVYIRLDHPIIKAKNDSIDELQELAKAYLREFAERKARGEYKNSGPF